MRTWTGVLAIEGVQTGDGRFIVDGACTWRTLPFALKADDTGSDHWEAGPVGNVATVERKDNQIVATGVIDDDTETGAELCRMLDAGTAPLGNRWPLSIEPDDIEMEVVDTTVEINPGDGTTDSMPVESPEVEASIVVGNARLQGRAALAMFRNGWRHLRAVRAAAGEGDPQGEIIYEESTDAIIQRYTALRIRAVAMVGTGALDGCYLQLDAASTDAPAAPTTDTPAEPPAVTAAFSTPMRPPRAWFDEPEPDEGDPRLVPQFDIDTGEYIGDAVPLHIGDDGQVYGHLAPKDRCHIGYSGMCVTPPESASAYSHYHIGYTVCDDDSEIPTGPLVAGCDHASTIGLSTQAARDWYAHNGLAWANVRIIPGRYGPWACGALRPGVTEELVYALRGGGISGDWRGVNGGLELIAVLAVNAPGFTVQRAMAASASRLVIPAARSYIEIKGDRVHLVTRPVVRAVDPALVAAVHTCDKCGGHAVSEELRLLRAIDRRTRLSLNEQAKAVVASRLGR